MNRPGDFTQVWATPDAAPHFPAGLTNSTKLGMLLARGEGFKVLLVPPAAVPDLAAGTTVRRHRPATRRRQRGLTFGWVNFAEDF